MTLAIDMSTWTWPQWTFAFLYAFNLLVAAALNGDYKNESAQKHNFPVTLVSAAIGIVILSAGGFFG